MSAVVSGLLVLAAFVTAATARPRSRLARLGARPATFLERLAATGQRILLRAEASGRLAVGCACLLAGTAAGLGYGPVAGMVGAVYAGIGVHAGLRRRADRIARRALTDALDGVASLVADLRAGVPPAASLGAALPHLIGAHARADRIATVADLDGHRDQTARGRLLARLAAAWRLAEDTGAPLADVLERLDHQVRTGERARALAAGHAASARATSVLLACLPLGGVALGYGIGADPLGVLFGTPVGGVCAGLAVCLQLVGLAWADRLARIDPERVEPPEVIR